MLRLYIYLLSSVVKTKRPEIRIFYFLLVISEITHALEIFGRLVNKQRDNLYIHPQISVKNERSV